MTHPPHPDDDHRAIAEAAQRLFADAITPAHHADAESGRWTDGLQALWQRVEDAGFVRLCASPETDGLALPWRAGCEVLMAVGRTQLPLPLAETAVATQLLSAAGLPFPTARSAAQRAHFSIAVARVRCAEAAIRAAGIAHQVHGAIGFTRGHCLHLTTGRLWAWRAEFGSDAHWADTLGGHAIAAGPDGFWLGITRRPLT